MGFVGLVRPDAAASNLSVAPRLRHFFDASRDRQTHAARVG
jgi:hypothetical protein